MDFTILEYRRFISQQNTIQKKFKRVVKDYEIDFEMGPGRITFLDNKCYNMKFGSICFRKPGQVVWTEGAQDTFLLTVAFSTKESSGYNRNISGTIHPKFSHILIDALPPIINAKSNKEIQRIYSELYTLTDINSPMAHELFLELLFRLNAEIHLQNAEKLKEISSETAEALNFMKQNFACKLTLNDIAASVHLEKSYFVRKFKKEYGITPFEMLKDLRLTYGADLVLNTDINIAVIAEKCGYNSTSFFIKDYKKKFGQSPKLQRNTVLSESTQ